jgi:hypothetical protein
MNTTVHASLRPSDRSAPNLGAIAVWLAASLITVFFALIVRDSAIIGELYVPRTNDSFYHARRILDAAVGSGFYQFDERLHAPEGTWVVWPWAYDYLVAKATQLALWLAPSLEPMAFISYVPVAWAFVNAALFLAAARAAGLSREMSLLAMFCFAFSPLTQLLHSIGMVDHHFIEHTFVLLTAWLGLRWFSQPDDHRRAIALGAALGAATAFHHGLFILQLFPLVAVFVLWLRGSAPPAAAILSFCAALVATTLLGLLPSEPFRNGMFEFGLHSWFHLYVAVCTTAAMTLMGHRPATRASFLVLAALSATLGAPLATELATGIGFLSGTFSVLDQITEVRSPYRLFTGSPGPAETLSYYSWLLLLAPVLLAFYVHRLVREHQPARLYYAVVVVLGTALLLNQMRLHYFGYFGLVTGGLLLVEQLRQRKAWHRGAVFVGTLAALVLAFQPALRERLFVYYAPSSDPEYATAIALFLRLNGLCAEDPGIVLAGSDDGNAILFHTDCSVIANNFILRPEDKTHIDETYRLLESTPAEILQTRPDIKYVLVRAEDFTVNHEGWLYLVDSMPIVKQFFFDEVPPPGYTLVEAISTRAYEGAPIRVFAKLFKLSAVSSDSAAAAPE